MFTLCGHVLAPGGDQPAMAKWMMMKGHNAVLPCQYCNIKGICTPNSTNPALYVPLNRSMLPDHGMPHCYDPLALPMHTHDDVIQKACKIKAAPNQTQQKSLATQSGINGLSLLTRLSSIRIPTSFPYDFMHLICENLIPNLVSLWTGPYRRLTAGTFPILIYTLKPIRVAT